MNASLVTSWLIAALATTFLAPATWAEISPYIIAAPANQTNYSGDTVTFMVTADGDAVLQYQWQKNGTDLTDGENLTGSTTSSLTLTDVTTADYGTYSVTVTNMAGTTNVSATLTVFTRLVQNGGFETGALAPWTITGNTSGFSVKSTGSGYAHSGNRGARIGPDGSLGYLSETIPTSTGQTYQISFWLKNNSAEPANEFAVWWNGNALYDQLNLGVFDWTNLCFNVQATTDTSVLTFGFQNDPSYFGLDDVSVLPVPSCRSATNAMGCFTFAFDALAGFEYQVQVTTNLFPATWGGGGDVVFSETNAIVTTSNSATYLQQFYRVAVLP